MDNSSDTEPSAVQGTPSDEKKWFVYVGDHHEGPFTVEEIQTKISQGAVAVDGFAWADGMGDWMPMSQIPAFGDGPSLTTLSKEQPHEAHPEPSAESSTQSPPLTLVAASQVDQPEMSRAPEQPHSAPAPAAKPRKPVSRKWAVLIVFLVIFSASALGFFKPLFQSPAFVAMNQTMSDAARPLMTGLVFHFPVLGKWFSPLPALEDVTPLEYVELKKAVLIPTDKGSAAGLAFSKSDLLSPVFYISTNLPDGTQLDVKIEGISDTLLNQLKFQTQYRVTTLKKLGKTEAVRAVDGKLIPRGEYTVSVIDHDGQPGQVVLVQKKYFLGGPRDETYLARLKDYHNKVKEKASTELAEIKQFTDVLDSQLTSSVTTFTKLGKGTPSKKSLKAWHDFHEKWNKLESQVSGTFKKLTPESLASDYFYGPLYLMTQQASQDIDRLHDVQDAFFKTKTDPQVFAGQLSEASTQAYDSVSALKNRVTDTEKQPVSADGVPMQISPSVQKPDDKKMEKAQ